MYQTLLVVPESKKAKLLESNLIKSVKYSKDFDKNNISEIIVQYFGSGGGEESGTRSIINLNEHGEPIYLYGVDYYTNEGVWGQNVATYRMEKVSWEFIDLNGDNIEDLKETHISHQGRDKKKPIENKIVSHFIFVKGKYTEVKK